MRGGEKGKRGKRGKRGEERGKGDTYHYTAWVLAKQQKQLILLHSPLVPTYS